MKLGIDNLKEHLDYFAGKRVGLITNPTGLASDRRSTVKVLQETVNLVCLFSPEHGVRGNIQAGVRFTDYFDEELGLPVYSLYTKDKKPTPEMLAQIDVLAIDIQDAGSRFYTYIYTMAYAMIACAAEGKEFVVFDRPNPLGRAVEGNILDLAFRSFVGYYPIVQRHGMTIGELALMFNEKFAIGCALKVIPLTGYDPHAYYDELPALWVAPSPNLPTIATAVVYNATCIFEGTNLSEGRGTTQPFELIGAPWINGETWAAALNAQHLPGVWFRPAYFTPQFSKNSGQLCGGVELFVCDRAAFRPVYTGWVMLTTVRELYPDDFAVNPPYSPGSKTMLELETGGDFLLKNSLSLAELQALLQRDSATFRAMRKPYLLYGDGEKEDGFTN